MQAHIHTYTHTNTHTSTHIHAHAHIHTHTHTHTQTLILTPVHTENVLCSIFTNLIFQFFSFYIVKKNRKVL